MPWFSKGQTRGQITFGTIQQVELYLAEDITFNQRDVRGQEEEWADEIEEREKQIVNELREFDKRLEDRK